jgi:hypothetical protein
VSGCSEDEVVNGGISGPGWWANGRVYSRRSLFLVAEMHDMGMAWHGLLSSNLLPQRSRLSGGRRGYGGDVQYRTRISPDLR